jgi:hypothetical protein
MNVLRSGAALVATLAVSLAVGGTEAFRAGQSVTRPFLGITWIDRTETTPRAIRMRAVQIDLDAPGIRFKLSPPAGPREVVRQTTLEFLLQEQAQIAVNAHFFLPFPSTDLNAELVGIAASDGRVYSAFEAPEQRYALVAYAPGLNIDSSNRARIVHHDAGSPDGLGVLEPEILWNTVSGSAQIVTDGRVTLPGYRTPSQPDAPLVPGGPGSYSSEKSWYDAVNARTAIGLSKDARTLTLFTVDARGGSLGMTVREVAEALSRDLGAWNALNLDGGGSTTLAMEDPRKRVATVVNAPSDPAGRAVGSNLAVFARRN